MAIFGPLVLTGGTTLSSEIRKIAISFNWGVVAASKPYQSIEEIKVSFNFSTEASSPLWGLAGWGKIFGLSPKNLTRGGLRQPRGLSLGSPRALPLDPLMFLLSY